MADSIWLTVPLPCGTGAGGADGPPPPPPPLPPPPPPPEGGVLGCGTEGAPPPPELPPVPGVEGTDGVSGAVGAASDCCWPLGVKLTASAMLAPPFEASAEAACTSPLPAVETA